MISACPGPDTGRILRALLAASAPVPHSPRLIATIPFVFVLLWSTGFIGAKYALPYIEPFTMLLIRMLLTLVAFLGLILVFKSEWPRPRDAMHQLVVGSLIHAGYLGGVFAAIKLGMSAGMAALIVGLQPLLTALFARLFLGNRLNARQWLGLGLGLIGVSLVLLQRENTGVDGLAGGALIAIVVALFSISIGTLYQKRFGQGSKLLTGSFFQYLATACWMGVLSFGFETQQITWSLTLILALAWLVVVLSIMAILLLMVMIREGEAARVASYFYLVPPVTALEGWLLFDERLSALALTGIVITVVGVYLVVRAGAGKDRSRQTR
jgi:drug/metabolite transporter (DMT)-like permease